MHIWEGNIAMLVVQAQIKSMSPQLASTQLSELRENGCHGQPLEGKQMQVNLLNKLSRNSGSRHKPHQIGHVTQLKWNNMSTARGCELPIGQGCTRCLLQALLLAQHG
eukprot:5101341-Amphidinium_carterae.1